MKSSVYKKFKTFGAKIHRDTSSKRKLSNCLELSIPTDRATIVAKLTLREAAALKKFIENNIVI